MFLLEMNVLSDLLKKKKKKNIQKLYQSFVIITLSKPPLSHTSWNGNSQLT